MTDHQPPQSLLDTIHAAGRRMRPRWFFWLKSVALALSTVLVAGLAVFAIGAAVFLYRERDLGTLPGFGWRGWTPFLGHFPWTTTIVGGLALIVLLVLVRRLTPSYRWPLMFLIAFAVIGGTAIGALTSRAPFHGQIANRALRGELPVIGPAFRPRFDDEQVFIGTVSVVTNDSVTMMVGDEMIIIEISDDTHQPPSFRPSIGDRLMVIGERQGDTIQAEGIRPAMRRSGMGMPR